MTDDIFENALTESNRIVLGGRGGDEGLPN